METNGRLLHEHYRGENGKDWEAEMLEVSHISDGSVKQYNRSGKWVGGFLKG